MNNFTQEEITIAKRTKDLIIKENVPELKAIYMAGEICMHEELKLEISKLQAFKDYVHERLDKMNIPINPEGEHSKAGCRIGDRMDIIEKQIHQLKSNIEDMNKAE